MELKIGRVLGIIIVVAIIAVAIFGIWAILAYNDLVAQEETIDSQWAQVTNEYQRKIDLIPELVATVDDYQEFEQSTLENITALRSQWMEAKTTEDQVNITSELDRALIDIVLTYEAYPYLQSIEAVRDLMVALEGTENRITVERMRYNEDVRDYNSDVRSFPRSLIAGWFDFERRSYYESGAGPDQP
ncbi:MAG: LemA family protein [Thermoplasmata archaeon]|nr:MAG: LemA family protein [Thermoplasmata archaeon]